MPTIPNYIPNTQPDIARLERELAVIAAHEAEKLHAITDPWSLLSKLRWEYEQLRHRARWYPRFLELTAPWPRADQDMLLAEAQRVFKVRLRVLRADLARAVASR